MKIYVKLSYLMLIFIMLTSISVVSQESAITDSSNIKLLKGARKIMIDAGVCSLITLDKEGNPRARTMDPFLPEDDFTVWFGTNSSSRKVTQIKNDPRVTLYYFESNTSGYVVISGTAQLINKPEKKDSYWKNEWEAFYPNERENYLLIKVTPIWLEVLDPAHGIYNNPKTWQPPIVVFDTIQ